MLRPGNELYLVTHFSLIDFLFSKGSCDKNKIKRHISSHKEAVPFTTNCKYQVYFQVRFLFFFCIQQINISILACTCHNDSEYSRHIKNSKIIFDKHWYVNWCKNKDSFLPICVVHLFNSLSRFLNTTFCNRATLNMVGKISNFIATFLWCIYSYMLFL